MSREKIQALIANVSPETINSFFRAKTTNYAGRQTSLADFDGNRFSDFLKCGEIKFDDGEKLVVVSAKVDSELSERSCRLAQYDKAKKILKTLEVYTAGIFVFSDTDNNFRFSLIYDQAIGRKRLFNNFRRFTFYARPVLANKTFIKQIESGDFNSLGGIKNAFSVSAVTDEFYNNFSPLFEKLADSVTDRQGKQLKDSAVAHDFALLFVIRTIFIGFIQKRKWIGGDENFLQKFLDEYEASKFAGKNKFYAEWLEPLFFEALASGPQAKFFQNTYAFSDGTRKKLRAAPFLNGGLFKQKKNIDDCGHHMPDATIKRFFEFLFAYNFTIEENTLYDQELELNPEFLGIIFERLINKENGAVYTPRPEVDFMCRLSLVKWLEKNVEPALNTKDLYELFFREIGTGKAFDEDQKYGSFSEREKKAILSALENITICDPAVGSGAFLVGMLHVLDEIEQYLRGSLKDSAGQLSGFERKKHLIGASLYGVEVKEWAVWITQLRLWITLFIDAPESLKDSFEPILPSLDFRVRSGDSLIQRIANKTFPISGHAQIRKGLKDKITHLKKLKTDFFQNKSKDLGAIRHAENCLFSEILDDEISQKQEAMRAIKKSEHGEQGDFFQPKILMSVEPGELFDKQVKTLQSEIEELRSQEASLSSREDHPLIWNIEFAEIFADKSGFDIVIGNPPYIRQEDIKDPKGKIEDKLYKSLLQEMVRLDFPEAFRSKEPIDAKSDLYAYFYIRSLRLLNPTGIHTFICSNSWLDVGYGKWLQKFLLKKSPIHLIIDNQAKRSFAEADVNTIISVVAAPQKVVSAEHVIKFIAFKKSFDDAVFTENLLEIENAKHIISNETFRVFPITNERLSEAGTQYDEGERKSLGGGVYIGNKWGGKYLHAPDIYWTIMTKGNSFLTKLDKHFEGERYLNTGGADGFFIPTHVELLSKHIFRIENTNVSDGGQPFYGEIEAEYLAPLIKDYTRTNRTIEITGFDAYCVVIKDKPSKLLQKYIVWGEQQGYQLRSVTKLQNPWYKPTNQMLSAATILVPRSFHNTFLIHSNPKEYLSLRFYRLHPKNKAHSQRLTAFLNSTLVTFFIETLGNRALGQGVLDFFMADFLAMDIPYIDDAALDSIFVKMARRPIQDIKTELENISEDRAQLDDVIFSAIGLTKGERNAVYEAVIRLVETRLSKAASLK